MPKKKATIEQHREAARHLIAAKQHLWDALKALEKKGHGCQLPAALMDKTVRLGDKIDTLRSQFENELARQNPGRPDEGGWSVQDYYPEPEDRPSCSMTVSRDKPVRH